MDCIWVMFDSFFICANIFLSAIISAFLYNVEKLRHTIIKYVQLYYK